MRYGAPFRFMVVTISTCLLRVRPGSHCYTPEHLMDALDILDSKHSQFYFSTFTSILSTQQENYAMARPFRA